MGNVQELFSKRGMTHEDLDNLANDVVSLTRSGDEKAFEFVMPIIMAGLLEQLIWMGETK
jgi:hypothetical protein